MKFSCKYKLNCGQSIIEVVVSIGIAAILAISLISTLLVTQKTSTSAKNKNEATKLAQEYMEQIRIFRDRNPLGLEGIKDEDCKIINTNASPDLWQSVDQGFNCTVQIPIGTYIFSRRFKVDGSNRSNGKILVDVIVTWDEKGEEKTITNSTFLSDSNY